MLIEAKQRKKKARAYRASHSSFPKKKKIENRNGGKGAAGAWRRFIAA